MPGLQVGDPTRRPLDSRICPRTVAKKSSSRWACSIRPPSPVQGWPPRGHHIRPPHQISRANSLGDQASAKGIREIPQLPVGDRLLPVVQRDRARRAMDALGKKLEPFGSRNVPWRRRGHRNRRRRTGIFPQVFPLRNVQPADRQDIESRPTAPQIPVFGLLEVELHVECQPLLWSPLCARPETVGKLHHFSGSIPTIFRVPARRIPTYEMSVKSFSYRDFTSVEHPQKGKSTRYIQRDPLPSGGLVGGPEGGGCGTDAIS